MILCWNRQPREVVDAPAGVQDLVGWGSGQPGLVLDMEVGGPACSSRVGGSWSLRFLPTQAILWFYDSMINFRQWKHLTDASTVQNPGDVSDVLILAVKCRKHSTSMKILKSWAFTKAPTSMVGFRLFKLRAYVLHKTHRFYSPLKLFLLWIHRITESQNHSMAEVGRSLWVQLLLKQGHQEQNAQAHTQVVFEPPMTLWRRLHNLTGQPTWYRSTSWCSEGMAYAHLIKHNIFFSWNWLPCHPKSYRPKSFSLNNVSAAGCCTWPALMFLARLP